MALGEYTRLLRQRWRIILAALILGIGAAVAYTALVTPLYQAKAQLYVSTVSTESASDLAQGSSFTQRQVSTYADIVRTPYVLRPVIEELGLDQSPQELAAVVVAEAKPETVLIDVSATDPDRQQALTIVEAVSEQVVVTLSELDRVEGTSDSPVKATIVSEAVASPTPISPQPARNLVLGAMAGLLIGLALALLRHLSDSSVRGEEDIHALTDAPVLGGIPFDERAATSPTVVVDEPYNPHSESFRAVRTNLQFVNAGQPPRSIVITSSVPGEGKTTTSAHLALTLAAGGMKVCLVEADLRRPKLMSYLGLEGGAGLTNVLIGQSKLEDMLQPYGETGVTLLGCGQLPPNPAELLGSPQMRDVLADLRERFDITIVDSPPLLPVTDAAVLAGVADGALVVVGASVVRREELARSLKRLRMAQAPILGVIVNRTSTKKGDGYAYDSYASTYAPHPTRRSRKRWLAGAGSGRDRG